MSKNFLTNKNILIILGIIAVVGIIYISINAASPTKTPPQATPPLPQPKSAKMITPVKDHPVTGQIIVKFKPQYSEAQINDYLQQFHASVIRTITGINQTVIKVPAGQEDAISQQLKNGPYVETVQRDYTTHAFFTPNDAYFNIQYALNNTGQAILGHSGKANADIRAEDAWDVTQGSGVKVAILDTGINVNQPDLAGKMVGGKFYTSGALTSIEDGNGHGTHVAGILAANTNNSVGVAGVCPGCQLIIVKVLDDTGSGTTSDAVSGITWAADQGAKVINMSLGTTDSSTESLYQQAVTYAMSKGAVVVAAAGNDGLNQLNYPAAVPGVVSVAATTNTDAKASYSNYGSWVQIAAPGDNILSTGPTHSFDPELEPLGYSTSTPYYYLSGTSMATPIVSGVAALIASTPYGTTPQAVINRLYSTADKISGTGTYWVNGRVDAAAAVGPVPTTATTVSAVPSLITPTLFCVGGNGTPPCATINPSGGASGSGPTLANASPGVSGSAANPSGSVGGGGGGNGSNLSGVPSGGVAPSGTPGTGSGTGGVCTNLTQLIGNATSSKATHDTKVHFKCQTGGGNGGGHRGGGGHGGGGFNGGFLSKLIMILLELLLELLQACSTQQPTTTPTPSVSTVPSSTIPSQGITTVPPVSGSPSTTTSTAPSTNPSGVPSSISPTVQIQSSACTNPVWSSADAQGTWNSNGFEVQNDAWNGDHGPQTIYACSPSNLYALSNQTNTGGEVKTYPDTGKVFNDAKTVGSYTAITSAFGEAVQQQGEWDAAYDIWTNNWGNELMIWNDTHNHPEIPPSGSQAVTIDGVAYHVWQNGSNYTAFMRDAKVQSGSVNILDVFKWLETKGWMKTSDKLTAIEYGVEVSVSESSPGVQGQQKFPITNFTLTAN